jgi:hypothetical protein
MFSGSCLQKPRKCAKYSLRFLFKLPKNLPARFNTWNCAALPENKRKPGAQRKDRAHRAGTRRGRAKITGSV